MRTKKKAEINIERHRFLRISPADHQRSSGETQSGGSAFELTFIRIRSLRGLSETRRGGLISKILRRITKQEKKQ